MASVRNITKRIDIPYEDGQHAVIRKLSWRQLERASDARSNAAIGKMRTMGGDVYRAITEAADQVAGAAGGEEKPAVAEKPTIERLKNLYDAETVLRFGVASLSYFEKFVEADVLDIDEKTKDFLVVEILEFSDVVKSAEELEQERKNG